MRAPTVVDTTDTQARILDAAERLFMQHGFAATSLRMITASARVNLAAVHYHFGSKEGLIRAVFGRRLGALNGARIARLERLEADAKGRVLTVEQIVGAMVEASRDLSRRARGGPIFLKLLGRAFAEPTECLRDFLPEQYREVVRRFKAAFKRALPYLTDQEIGWRMHFAFGTLAYAMAGVDAARVIATCKLKDAENTEAVLAHLVPIMVAGFKAPATGKHGGGKAKTRNARVGVAQGT